MELKQLKYFLCVAELGSFSKAAVQLSVAQPILSRQIRSLEHDLNAELFYRNGRGIVLSEAGKLLEAYAKEIALIQGKVELVQSLDALDSGRWDYVKEFVNIVSAFEQFSRSFEQEKSQPVEERARAARSLIPGIISYLLPIRG